jgi:hypothetical protein
MCFNPQEMGGTYLRKKKMQFPDRCVLEIMASSGMLRRVALVRADVSEELSASFIRVTRISVLRTTLAVTSNRLTLRRNTNVGSYKSHTA